MKKESFWPQRFTQEKNLIISSDTCEKALEGRIKKIIGQEKKDVLKNIL